MLKLALILFFCLGLGGVGTGLAYLTTTEFMTYHSGAVQTKWSDLGPNFQGLFLGMLKAMGAGSLITGLATVCMSVMGLRGVVRPYVTLLPLVNLGYLTLVVYATYVVDSQTAGNPPLIPGLVTLVVSAGASAMLVFANHRQA